MKKPKPIHISTFWDKCPTGMMGCYFLYSNTKEIIYIGKSRNCIRQRINDHCFQRFSRYLEDYQIERKQRLRAQTCFFSFIEMCEGDIDLFERRLIASVKPIHNLVLYPGYLRKPTTDNHEVLKRRNDCTNNN